MILFLQLACPKLTSFSCYLANAQSHTHHDTWACNHTIPNSCESIHSLSCPAFLHLHAFSLSYEQNHACWISSAHRLLWAHTFLLVGAVRHTIASSQAVTFKIQILILSFLSCACLHTVIAQIQSLSYVLWISYFHKVPQALRQCLSCTGRHNPLKSLDFCEHQCIINTLYDR